MEPAGRNTPTNIHHTSDGENKKLRKKLSSNTLEKLENQILDLMQSVAELRMMQLEEAKKQNLTNKKNKS